MPSVLEAHRYGLARKKGKKKAEVSAELVESTLPNFG
jgi:hypothetical protein